jgi:hypothetical protein
MWDIPAAQYLFSIIQCKELENDSNIWHEELGIEFDSNKLECRLPVEKIVKTKVALENAHKKKKITLRSLQSQQRSIYFP